MHSAKRITAVLLCIATLVGFMPASVLSVEAESMPDGSGECLQMYTSDEFGHWDDTPADGDHGGGIRDHGFICEWEQ